MAKNILLHMDINWSKMLQTKNYKVYKNKYALPYGYTYKNFIPEEKWEKLSSIDKQDALLQGIVLENYNGKIQETSVKSLSQKIDYKITCKNNDVTINDNSFVAASDGAEIKIKFKGLKNSETYFSIKGLDLEDTSNDAKLTIKSSKDIAKKLFYRTKESRNYNGRHDYIVNLGYSKKALKKITITFPFAGTYLLMILINLLLNISPFTYISRFKTGIPFLHNSLAIYSIVSSANVGSPPVKNIPPISSV